MNQTMARDNGKATAEGRKSRQYSTAKPTVEEPGSIPAAGGEQEVARKTEGQTKGTEGVKSVWRKCEPMLEQRTTRNHPTSPKGRLEPGTEPDIVVKVCRMVI